MLKYLPNQMNLSYWLGDLDLAAASEDETADAAEYLYWLITESEPEIDLELGTMEWMTMFAPDEPVLLHVEIPASIGFDQWVPVKDGHPLARALYERHYSSQNRRKRRKERKTKLFMGPGNKLPLILPRGDAGCFWRKEYFHNGNFMGVNCTLFRNESEFLSSELLLKTEAVVRRYWPYEMRLFTYVDATAVRSKNPGYCFICAGWKKRNETTDKGLLIFEKKVQPYVIELLYGPGILP